MTQYQQVSNSIDTVTSVSWEVCNECGSTFLQASEHYNEPNVTEAKRNEMRAQNITSLVVSVAGFGNVPVRFPRHYTRICLRLCLRPKIN
jgi:hypothetical protein